MVENITLGSGKLYVAEYTGDALPEVDTLKTEQNQLGYIKGGASVEYTKETYDAEDDLGYAKKTVITSEGVTLKSGVMTWNGATLKKLCETARVTEDPSKGVRTVKVGGVDNADGKNYAILFYHEDKADGDKWVVIAGRNQAGFSLAFAKDSETVIDAEFKAVPCDSEGTLLVYGEQDESLKG